MFSNNSDITSWAVTSPSTLIMHYSNGGLLCRWSLSLQEFDFNNEYSKGTLNTNVDTLSRCHEEGTRQHNVAATFIHSGETDMQKDQQ